jgi:hypothetical protein
VYLFIPVACRAANLREEQLKSAMGDEGAASAAARDLAAKTAAERDALAEELAKVGLWKLDC